MVVKYSLKVFNVNHITWSNFCGHHNFKLWVNLTTWLQKHYPGSYTEFVPSQGYILHFVSEEQYVMFKLAWL